MLFTKKSVEDDKGTDFIKIDSDQNQTRQKIHALAIANLRRMNRIRCKNIIEDVPSSLDRLHKLRYSLFSERPYNIEWDLLLDFQILARDMIKHTVNIVDVQIFII